MNTPPSGCSEGLWGGIEVQGDPNEALTPLHQGYVELKNDAIIENANIGIHCVLNEYMPAENGLLFYASGGIINASGAVFNNNTTAINIEHWKSMFTNYVSNISNCTFEHPS